MIAPRNRLRAAFEAARADGRVAFVPFATAGFPSPTSSIELLQALADSGADVIELGVPFSDPIADGATIQRTSQQALEAGMSFARVLDLVRVFRRRSSVPVVLMSYANPLLQFGEATVAAAIAESGAEGILVTDLPPDERREWWDTFRTSELATVQLVAPTTSSDRIPTIAAAASGFVYAVSRSGVTGDGSAFSSELPNQVARIRASSDLPVAVGFGVRRAADVEQVSRFADGVVVGAALLERVLAEADEAAGIRAAADLARELRRATRRGD